MGTEQYVFSNGEMGSPLREYANLSTVYDENKDIETLKKEHNGKCVIWDTFQTDTETLAIGSAINLLSEVVENTLDEEWNDEEEKQKYTETLKHLCRVYIKNSDKDGRYLK